MVDVEALKAAHDLVSVVGHYTPLTKRGAEWVGRCVSHSPDNHPSLWVNPRKGIVHCFACGFSADLISFIQQVEGLDFKAACERLGATNGHTPNWTPALAAPESPAIQERITSKPPFGEPAPNMATRQLGAPSKIWPYRDSDGEVLGYIARYDGEAGKEIRCWTWGQRGDEEPQWACGHWSKPRPLYGLDRLEQRRDAKVLICEGEKAADAAGRLLPPYVAITWPGGAQAVHKADYRPLRGRYCVLWPDADAAGAKAMAELGAVLADPRGLACTVKLIDTGGMPDGWDAADAETEGWDGAKTIAWALPKLRTVSSADVAPTPPPPPIAPEAPRAPEPTQAPAISPPAKPALRLVTREGNLDLAPEPQPILPLSLSESGLAKEFCDAHHETSRYVWEYGKWLSWNGSRWLLERGRETPYAKVGAIVHGIKYRAEAAELTVRDKRKMESRAHIGNILDISQHDRRIVATPALFDSDPMLLGTPSGTVDLRTGLLRAPLKADYLTRQTTVAPAEGQHPLFDRVLGAAADGNEELLSYLWRWLGYLLTGDVREEAFLFLYGKPQSGKTTLIEAIASILGSTDDGGYAALCEMDLLAESKMERGTDRLIKLAGARFAYASETEEGRHWKASLLKLVTGGDRLPGRRLYEESVSFKPTHKLWVFGNFRPHLRTADGGVKRRLHLLEYHGAISDAERDSTLKKRLTAEYPSILHSMIEGCLAWQRDGLMRPAEISSNVEEYMEAEDTLGAWLEECTESSKTARTGSKQAYTQYHAYIEGRGERPATQKRFSMDLRNRGYTIIRSGGSHIVGLALKTPPRNLDFDDAPPADWADR